jgi:hypothetical protein
MSPSTKSTVARIAMFTAAVGDGRNDPSQCHVIARHAKGKPTAMTVAQRFRMIHAA